MTSKTVIIKQTLVKENEGVTKREMDRISITYL